MDTLLDPENERSKTYEINHAMGSPVVVNEQDVYKRQQSAVRG